MRHARYLIGAVTACTVASSMAAPAFAADSLSAKNSGSTNSAAENYVALGDSYASGTGTRDYFEDSGDCLRSPKAYPQLWADEHGAAAFEFAACSGAVTDDVNADQLGSLSADTTLVTISIGGNDIGFVDVVTRCVAGTDEACDSAVSDATAKAHDELPAKLDTTYANIREAAPNAKVVVVGYPRLNEMGDCGVPFYTENKRQRINEGADELASVISDRASAAGFSFADPREAFAGHGVCSSDEWINGPSTPIQESFHPDVDGHANAYLPTLDSVTG
ncbi:SGNH/GDSL hydrolase family protein [Saccharopolyspora sp. TS4A08]|uniref:SGNH/GDSL hydrolase family protein n=1 Tax=Saccharopolyspora ipomoeae TaxID=3042027 RepID=A0ABT6PN02_9PSEU|nr:SGNH/GDSL hydrolase family protein [Saccharopolyspora sp. TS4A08]MDI2029386.1 SGNH/GDSL hydrolase family protein [Saccharopolyspora sp. TS4A08]